MKYAIKVNIIIIEIAALIPPKKAEIPIKTIDPIKSNVTLRAIKKSLNIDAL